MRHISVPEGLQIQYCEAIGSSLSAIDWSYISGDTPIILHGVIFHQQNRAL